MNSVSSAYKLWAKKIEILLRSQDAWKIKAGLDRAKYSVGHRRTEGPHRSLDGLLRRIDPRLRRRGAVRGGVLYLDTRMSKELLAEGYAKEIVELVKEARQDMKLEGTVSVEIGTRREQGTAREAAALEGHDPAGCERARCAVRHEPGEDAYVIEAGLGKRRSSSGSVPPRCKTSWLSDAAANSDPRAGATRFAFAGPKAGSQPSR